MHIETIKVDAKTDHFIDLFVIIQKDIKLINSLSIDKKEFLKKTAGKFAIFEQMLLTE